MKLISENRIVAAAIAIFLQDQDPLDRASTREIPVRKAVDQQGPAEPAHHSVLVTRVSVDVVPVGQESDIWAPSPRSRSLARLDGDHHVVATSERRGEDTVKVEVCVLRQMIDQPDPQCSPGYRPEQRPCIVAVVSHSGKLCSAEL